jgi:hypothetical protein
MKLYKNQLAVIYYVSKIWLVKLLILENNSNKSDNSFIHLN